MVHNREDGRVCVSVTILFSISWRCGQPVERHKHDHGLESGYASVVVWANMMRLCVWELVLVGRQMWMCKWVAIRAVVHKQRDCLHVWQENNQLCRRVVLV